MSQLILGTPRAKPVLVNPKWDKDTPCIPTKIRTPSGNNKLTIREAVSRLDDVRHYCITQSPGFASIAASVKHIVLTPVSDMFEHVAFTDGWRVYYGKGFFQEDQKAQAAIIVHEVHHVALRHCQRALRFFKNYGHPYGGKNFNAKMWNLAADCIVNHSTFSAKWIKEPSCGCIKFETMVDGELLKAWPPHRWNVEKLYTYLMDKATDPTQGQGGEDSKAEMVDEYIKKMTDALDKVRSGDMDPNALLGDLSTIFDQVEEDSEDQARNWNSRMQRAAAGDVADGMLRRAMFDLPVSKTPWRSILRRWLTAHVLPTTEPHIFKPSRAMISAHAHNKVRKGRYRVPFDPGIQPASGVGRIAVCVDTSGSVSDDDLREFCAEIQSIRSSVGAAVTLIAADAEVGNVIDVPRHKSLIDEVKKAGGFAGGGGTNFRPAVAYANENLPDAAVIIYLTDMMGPYPEESRLPIIWAATMDPNPLPNVGRIIRIMKD